MFLVAWENWPVILDLLTSLSSIDLSNSWPGCGWTRCSRPVQQLWGDPVDPQSVLLLCLAAERRPPPAAKSTSPASAPPTRAPEGSAGFPAPRWAPLSPLRSPRTLLLLVGFPPIRGPSNPPSKASSPSTSPARISCGIETTRRRLRRRRSSLQLSLLSEPPFQESPPLPSPHSAPIPTPMVK